MKIVVGLGNPGIQYQFTPHNIGFLVVDRLAERHGAHLTNRRSKALTGKCRIGEHEVLLAKPETFMNLSGMSVRALVEEYAADATRDLLAIYDELDLPFGALRVRERGGSAGHNGMESILGALGTQEVMRIRIGIAPARKPRDGAAYVLSQFKKSQYKAVDAALDRAADAVETIFTDGRAKAMNRFNSRLQAEGPE